MLFVRLFRKRRYYRTAGRILPREVGNPTLLQAAANYTVTIVAEEPFVIDAGANMSSTIHQIEEEPAFRHIFRNVYGYNLDPDRLKELVLELPETVDIFTEDVRTFMNILDQKL